MALSVCGIDPMPWVHSKPTEHLTATVDHFPTVSEGDRAMIEQNMMVRTQTEDIAQAVESVVP